MMFVFFFNDTATTEIYTYCHTLSLHDALPIFLEGRARRRPTLYHRARRDRRARTGRPIAPGAEDGGGGAAYRRHRTRFQQSAHRHFRRVGDARLADVAGARRRFGALYRGHAGGDRAPGRPPPPAPGLFGAPTPP